MARLRECISASTAEKCGNESFPVLSITMKDGIVLQSDKFKKRIASADTSNYICVPFGKLVQGIHIDEGNFGIQDIVPIGIVSPAYKLWDVNEDVVLPKYIEMVLRSPKCIEYYKSKLTGTVNRRGRMSVTDFLDMEVPLPNKEKQCQIVKNMNKVNQLIALRKEQLAKLDQLVKSRFIELFGTVKNNHQEHPVIKISGCAKLQGGFAFKSSDYLDNGIRLVQISNVNKDTLDWDSINCVPQTFLQKYKDFELHVGDLVLAMTRPVIKSLDAVKIATVSENDVPSLLNQRVGRFIIDITKINSTYLMLCCQMTEFREYVEAMSGNSLQPNISSKQVEDYSIVLPPLELQEQFAAFVEQTDKSKLAIQQSLDKLELLKKSLMQEYFG